MKNEEFGKAIELLADKATLAEYNDLAIVLYAYLGSEKVGMSSDFARHCQIFVRKRLKEINLYKNRRNN